MATRSDTASQGYGYADEAAYRGTARDSARAESSHGKDVVGVLLALTMILGPLAAGAFGS